MEKPILQEIRKDFYTYRNGILADSLKNLYPDHTKIFGLMVPQFIEVAKKYPKDLELGKALWEDKSTRESRLLALYILPAEKIDKELAKRLFHEIQSIEEADFLAFRILRHLSFARDLYEELTDDESPAPLKEYSLRMFKKNLDSIA